MKASLRRFLKGNASDLRLNDNRFDRGIQTLIVQIIWKIIRFISSQENLFHSFPNGRTSRLP